jgi:hypothetical protein
VLGPDELDERGRAGLPHLLVDHVELAVGGVDRLADDVARQPRRVGEPLGLDDGVGLRVAPRRCVDELDLGDDAAVHVLFGFGHEVGKAQAERLGKAGCGCERGLPRLSLDEPDVRLVHAGALRELVGRQPFATPDVGDEACNDLADVKSVLRHR